MSNPFFDHPILNSPYEYPRRHWELDEAGQPTQQIIENRRGAKFVTPIPKPKKRKAAAQADLVFDEGKGLSSKEQRRKLETHPKTGAAQLVEMRETVKEIVVPVYVQAEPSALPARAIEGKPLFAGISDGE